MEEKYMVISKMFDLRGTRQEKLLKEEGLKCVVLLKVKPSTELAKFSETEILEQLGLAKDGWELEKD